MSRSPVVLALQSAIFLGLLGCTQTRVESLPVAEDGRSPAASPALAEITSADRLTPEQTSSLRALDIPVVVPGYLPEAFEISEVKANLCAPDAPQRGNCREGSSYTLVYRNAQNTCLLVNGVSGGVGGGSSEFEFQTPTELLGEVTILFGPPTGENQAPSAQQLTTPQANLGSFPATLSGRSLPSPLYNVVVGDGEYYRETYGCGENASVTPQDLEKVLQALVILE